MNLLDACRGSRDDFHDYGTLRVTPYSVPFWIASKEVNHAERRTNACVREPARHTCRDDGHHTFKRSNCLQLRWACGVKTLRKGVRLNSQMLN